MIFGSHVIILGLLASLHERHGVSNHPFNLINYQPRCLIKDESGLPIIASLPEDVALDHQDAVQGDLLVIQDQLIVNVLLDDGSGGTYSVRHLYGRCRVGLFEVLLDLLLVTLSPSGMLIIANVDDLQDEELPLDLHDLMEREDVNGLLG
jgi:hypothetical protein